jgi:hypothetical protein
MAYKRRHSHKKRTSGRRHYKGGAGAAEFMLGVVGNGDTQFNNVMNNSSQSNVIVPIARSQTAGRGSRKRNRRGGFLGLGGVINQAVVPLSILGMQQTYGRKRQGGTRRKRR